ncbi:hypothetical protein [Xanthobacter tagetidis]|jgi:hypothetical protein|uniref:Uncharacterized protein n=1 Tax=Xanthobacter tagetidis TaxID=60216 RepID=A0A3L7A6U3_9HYPH|nr:hypothetical protein [Xanthobacter tagetidis]MBB6307301.1 hypothetical protein [Xanthobacter tagetidis]RLP75844.1 hypothetical protein D9R14_16270 [Xanthobacter tagetidis]
MRMALDAAWGFGRIGQAGAGAIGALMLGAALAGPAAAQAPAGYSFASPPSAEANRVYGVNHKTGEMSVCQFERPAGSFAGITRCFTRGDGAGAQADGNYDLVPTRFAGETGIFRVNRDTGEMSICYVRDAPQAGGKNDPILLCTPPAK